MVLWLLFTTSAEVAIIALLSKTEFSLLGFYPFSPHLFWVSIFFFFSWTLLDQPTKKVQESQCHVTFKFPRGALLRLCTCDRSFHLFLNVLTNYWFALHSRSFSPTAKPLCLTSLHKRQRNRKDRVNQRELASRTMAELCFDFASLVIYANTTVGHRTKECISCVHLCLTVSALSDGSCPLL